MMNQMDAHVVTLARMVDSFAKSVGGAN